MTSSVGLDTARNPEYSSVIPDDNLPQIFGDLPLKDLYCSSLVCSIWNRVANSENLPLFQGRKNDWSAGNECLRRSLTENAADSLTPPSPQLTTLLLQRTLCPFSDRKAIIEHLTTTQAFYEGAAAFRSAAGYGSLQLCESLLPLVKNTCIVEEALGCAIRNGHMHIVKRLLSEIPPENLKELIRINVKCNVEEGAAIYLEGQIGAGSYDLNCWEKGFPMKKVRGSEDLWEIILLPVVYGEKAREYNPEVDHISFPFRPVLHFANGMISIPKMNYEVNPRANITITPTFNH